jgi:hypothetical protein
MLIKLVARSPLNRGGSHETLPLRLDSDPSTLHLAVPSPGVVAMKPRADHSHRHAGPTACSPLTRGSSHETSRTRSPRPCVQSCSPLTRGSSHETIQYPGASAFVTCLAVPSPGVVAMKHCAGMLLEWLWRLAVPSPGVVAMKRSMLDREAHRPGGLQSPHPG